VPRAKRVILGVTGSIAAYKAAEIIRRLIEKGLKVSVVMTNEAEHFITPLTLSGLAGEEVYKDWFDQNGQSWSMPHIRLAEEADVLLIAPATASIIGKMAHGLADSLLTCIVLGTKAPILSIIVHRSRSGCENPQNALFQFSVSGFKVIVYDNMMIILSLLQLFFDPVQSLLDNLAVLSTSHRKPLF